MAFDGSIARHRFSASSTSFLAQYGSGSGMVGMGDQEMDLVMLDHGYSKPWSAHPDASSARPLRTLFMTKAPRGTSLEQMQRNVEADVDVDDTAVLPQMPFDIAKARSVMTECERHASFSRPDDNQDDWEDKLSKVGWTVQQTRIWSKVIKALQADRLARLAMDGIPNEPIARRLLVDKTAKRLRHALANVGWDMKIVQWLHSLMLDVVSTSLLASYLDALQTLRAKLPSLVDKMVTGVSPRHPSLSVESLGLLLKRPWDPVGNALAQQKPKKLPGNPLLLIAPCGPMHGSVGQMKRLKSWQNHLSGLGKVAPVTLHTVNGGNGVSVSLCMEQIIGAVRTKVLELKSHFPSRPIVLIGWNIGALVACHVSLIESVNAVVCLGFPFSGIHGPRGDVEDPLLDSRTPTLFVIGQNASDCSMDQLQDLREHMRAETGLVVVGGADENLRLSHHQKRHEGLTQAMADRCIIDEICQFLGSILSLSMHTLDSSQEVHEIEVRKKRKRKSRDEMTSYHFEPLPLPVRDTSSGAGRVSKRGGKVARQTFIPDLSQIQADCNRAAPRKRQGRGRIPGVSRKRLTLSLGVNQLGTLTSSLASPSSQSSYANIVPAVPPSITTLGNAQELSGLLQGIRLSRSSTDLDGNSSSVVKSLVNTSIPLTKLLTLGKLSESVDVGRVGSLSGTTPSTTLLAKAVKTGEVSEKEGQIGRVNKMPNLSQLAQQQQQILVRTGGPPGSSSLTIPISMAHRLVGLSSGSPLVHITGSSPTSSTQIHQLLSSVANGTAAAVSVTGSPQTFILATGVTSSSTATISNTITQGAGRVLVTTSSRGSKFVQGSEKVLQLSQDKSEPEEKGFGPDRAQDQSEEDRVQTIQKMQFHDFPLTTTSLAASTAILTQGKVHDSMAKMQTLSVPDSIVSALNSSGGNNRQPMIMQVGVSKSVVKPVTVSGSVTSILNKMVACSSSPGISVSPSITASSFAGSKGTVLITSLGKVPPPLPNRPDKTEANKATTSFHTSTSVPVCVSETLGKVSSLLESGAGVATHVPVSVSALNSGTVSASGSPLPKTLTAVGRSSGPMPSVQNPLVSGSQTHVTSTMVTSTSSTLSSSLTSAAASGRGGHKSTVSSYTASAKPYLQTVASTRTRRIRTPKQYDL